MSLSVESVVSQRAAAASILLKEALANTINIAQSKAVAAEAKSVAGSACKSLASTIGHLRDGMKHSNSIKKIPQLTIQQPCAEDAHTHLGQAGQFNSKLKFELQTKEREVALTHCNTMIKEQVALANTVWLKLMEKR